MLGGLWEGIENSPDLACPPSAHLPITRLDTRPSSWLNTAPCPCWKTWEFSESIKRSRCSSEGPSQVETGSPAGPGWPYHSFFALTHFLVLPLGFSLTNYKLLPRALGRPFVSRWESLVGHGLPPASSARWRVLRGGGEAYGTDVLGGT